VAFTFHKCLKYYQGRVKKINDNVKPFTKVESHFADAGFFEEDDAPKETMRLTIASIGKCGTENALRVRKEDVPKQSVKNGESKKGDTPSFIN